MMESYMMESSFVTSYYFGRRFAIHLRNIHLPAGMKKKMTWFVYLIPAVNFSMLEAPLMSVLVGLKQRRPARTAIGTTQPCTSTSKMGVKNTAQLKTSDIYYLVYGQ